MTKIKKQTAAKRPKQSAKKVEPSKMRALALGLVVAAAGGAGYTYGLPYFRSGKVEPKYLEKKSQFFSNFCICR